jgi:hypothetical protein
MTAPTLRSGIELSALSPGIRPQDDLFRHVNGAWLERTEIPDDKARWGSFHLIAEQAEKDVRAIIEESTTPEPGTRRARSATCSRASWTPSASSGSGPSPSRPSWAAWTPSTPSRRCCAPSARWSGRASAA